MFLVHLEMPRIRSLDTENPPSEAKLEADIKSGKAVTPVGKNAEAAGFKPGEPVRLKTFEIDRHQR